MRLLTESAPSIERVLAGETLHTTARRRRKDGHILDLEVHAVPFAVDGRVRGSYSIYKDISEQIRAAQAERKHAEVLNQLVTELQLRTKQMTLLSEMGDLLECCGTTEEACAVVAQSVQKLSARGTFRSPVPVQVVAEPGGGGGAVGQQHPRDPLRSRCVLESAPGSAALECARRAASTVRTWPTAQPTNACACP